MKIILSFFFLCSNLFIFSLGFLKKETLNLSNEKTEVRSQFTFEKYAIDKNQFKKFYSRKEESGYGIEINQKPANTVQRLSSSLFKYTNSSFVIKDINQLMSDNRKWDFKLLDKQLEEIFNTMLINQETTITINGLRSYIQLFLNNYESCDRDKDNVLIQTEFVACFSTDPFLAKITLPPKDLNNPIDFSDSSKFYATLFDILNERRLNYLNFVDYMKLRLFLFSIQKCSISSGFLDEVGFECAIEIASGYKSFTRTKARRIFRTALDIDKNPNNINLDFISYVTVASAIRLFGSINGKENDDITRSEFNLALDRNNLPDRYNQDIINHMFKLIQQDDRPDQGLDMKTFIFLDMSLRLFSPDNKKRKFFMTYDEFTNSFYNYMFPFQILAEIEKVPAYSLSPQSYNMFQFMNISKFSSENDYLYKFLEVEAKVEKKILSAYENNNENFQSQAVATTDNSAKTIKPLLNINQNLMNYTASLIFNLSDEDYDGYISFYDYGIFMQIAQIFSKKDEINKGAISASQLYDLFTGYSDFPSISANLKKKAERFYEFHKNSNLDLVSALQILRIEDIASFFKDRADNSNLIEIDLKRILQKVNMNFVPNELFQECFRGVDHRNLPLFDWECCFNKGMKKNLEYFEAMNNYKLSKQYGFTLSSMEFYNVDPNYA
jgi:hypothetical protein